MLRDGGAGGGHRSGLALGLALAAPRQHEVGDFLRVGRGAADLAGIFLGGGDPPLDVGGTPARIVAHPHALAILLDWTKDTEFALRRYQQFKWEKVARWPMDEDWSLQTSELQKWLDGIEAESRE